MTPKACRLLLLFLLLLTAIFALPLCDTVCVCVCARVLQFLLLLSLAEEQAAAAEAVEEEAEEAGICCPKPKNTTPHRPLKHTHTLLIWQAPSPTARP